MRRAGILALGVWLLAAGERPLEVTYGGLRDHLTASFDLGVLFDGAIETQMENGLTNRVVMAVSLHAIGDDGRLQAPVSVTIRSCEVVYDLWGERWGVSVDDGSERRRRVVTDYEEVKALCGRVTNLWLAPLGALDLRRQYVVAVRVDINPVDPDVIERTQDYLGDPIGHRRAGESGGGTLFGTLARIFFREPAEVNPEPWRFTGPPFGHETVQRVLEGATSPDPQPEQEEE